MRERWTPEDFKATNDNFTGEEELSHQTEIEVAKKAGRDLFKGTVEELVRTGFPAGPIRKVSDLILAGRPNANPDPNSYESHLYDHLTHLLFECQRQAPNRAAIQSIESTIQVLQPHVQEQNHNVVPISTIDPSVDLRDD